MSTQAIARGVNSIAERNFDGPQQPTTPAELKKPAAEKLKHLISADQFTIPLLEELHLLSKAMEEFLMDLQAERNQRKPETRLAKDLKTHRQINIGGFLEERGVRGKVMYSFFYEESLRTRMGFETGWEDLGGKVSFKTTQSGKISSVSEKGESLEDAIQVLSCKSPNVIVLRHPDDDSAERAVRALDGGSTWGSTSIINAGSGKNEHPTQAFGDWDTLRRLLGEVDKIRIGFMGDLKRGRTVTSLSLLLSQYPGVEMYFIAPEVNQISPALRQKLCQRNIKIHEIDTGWRQLLENKSIDVLYQTRLQKERFDPNNKQELEEAIRFQAPFTITPEIGELMNENHILLMHPRPISDLKEIHPACDKYRIAAYKVTQIQACILGRMALYSKMLGPKGTALA